MRATRFELATVGFLEAFLKYRKLKQFLYQLVTQAEARKTKWAILIDFPGFNLRLAQQLKKKNVQCILVVSPQIWAWRYKRIYEIKKYFKLIYD